MFLRIALVVSLALIGLPFAFTAPTTELVSVASDTSEGNGDSGRPVLSTDGRYMAFQSKATNLVPTATNGQQQVFLRDNLTGFVQLVSKSTSGSLGGSAPSYSEAISANGRFVAFQSYATDLISGDTNAFADIFVRDVQSGTTTRVSITDTEVQANGHSFECAISTDGRFIAFRSEATNLVTGDTNGVSDIFMRDTVAQTTTRLSVSSSGGQANGQSFNPSISADGRYVAFNTFAYNLLGGDTNGYQDVYVRDTVSNITTRVSVSSSGVQGNGPSGEYGSSISSDGGYIAFASYASNLVTGDTNLVYDIFVHDLYYGTTERVSLTETGDQPTGGSFWPTISSGGTIVTFHATATNLVPGDTNGMTDVFVRDTAAGTTKRISVTSGEAQANGDSYNPSLSADGLHIAYESTATNLVTSDTNAKADVFIRDATTGVTRRGSVIDSRSTSASYDASVNSDGRYIAFYSYAPNLVASDTNGTSDVFLRDTALGTTTRVSVSTGGAQAGGSDPSISADGRYVAFESSATNLVTGDTNGDRDVFVLAVQAGTTTRVSVSSSGSQANDPSGNPSISADGRYVAFYSIATNLVTGDTNGSIDIFVRDVQAGTTTRVSVSTGGAQAGGSDPSISADGRYVAFESSATNLVTGDTNGDLDVFVRDVQAGTTTRVSLSMDGLQGNSGSSSPSISSDGRYVAFYSIATNLVSSDTNGTSDIFVRDISIGTTFRVSVSSGGQEGNSGSYAATISSDGRYVAFSSEASNLVAGDTGNLDIFVRDLAAGTTSRLSVSTEGTQADGSSDAPDMSGDGRYVAFGSSARNLVADDTNGNMDVFLRGPLFGDSPTPVALVYITQPGGALSGQALNPQPVVRAVDSNGNTVTDFTGGVTLSIKSGTGATGAILNGFATITCIAGVASFTNLSIDKPGTGYVLTATSPSLTSADSVAFNITQVATNLVFNVQPGNATESTPFGTQPIVIARYPNGTIATDYTAAVTISIKSGTGTAGATLSGTRTLNCVAGVAFFTNLSIDKPGTGYILTATSTGLTSTDSAAFNVTQPATSLSFSIQPGNAKEGLAFGTRPVVIAKYGDGTTATDYTGAITVAIKSGTGTTGAILSGTKTVNCVAGVATFTNLSIDKPGTGYVLVATSLGLTSADSAAFNVAQVAKALAFSVEPGNARAGFAFSTQPVVVAKYGDGTTATDYTGSVTLAIKSGTGTTGAILSGTKTVNCVAGVATFTNLSIDKTGTGYVLVATSLGLASAESEPFTVAQSTAVLRISVSSEEVQANAASTVGLGVSQDGRWVTYLSSADNLVAGDTNAVADVFLRDTLMGTTQRVSESSDGIQANAASADGMDVSDEGRYVSFVSYADNLAGDDANGVRDVFRHDTWTGRTECASVGLDGQPSSGESRWTSLSADGRYLAFYSNATNIVPGVLTAVNHCYIRDMVLGTTILVDVTPEGVPGNQRGYGPVLSEDGRTVLFVSDATDLVADDTNNVGDVFVRDLATGMTSLVSRSTAGVIGNGYSGDFGATISADGTKVAFASIATNLVSSDTNGFRDIFVRDLTTGVTTRVSVGTAGMQANNWSGSPTLSRNGGKVSFYSHASNLVDDDTNGLRDAFVRDTATGKTTLVNRASDGTLGNGAAYWSRLSGDGRFVTFFSEATNLVPGDTNGVSDLFISGPLDASVVFAIQPETGIPGGPLEPQPVVHVRTINGELLSTFTGDVTLSIKPGSGTQGSVLGGTTKVTAIGGVATFNNLSINLAGSGYVLVATGEGLSNAESAAFDIRPQASNLAFSVQPGDAKEGYAFGTQPAVVARYPDGSTATDYTGPVTLAIKSGTGTAGAILSGTTTVNCVSGVATFTNLSINEAGTGYVLVVSGIGLVPGESAAFDVAQRATTLAFSVQPGNAKEGRPFGIQPVVVAKRANGLTATNFTGAVTLSIKPGTGADGAILSGTAVVNCIAGVAAFTDLAIDKAGLGYVLTATSSDLTPANSTAFDVGVAPGGVTGVPFSWGNNDYGQLGNGDFPGNPRQALITDVLQAGAGNGFSVALKTDGTVWAWGNNGSGQLGDGTTTSSVTPVQVSGLTNVISLSAGYYQCLAVKTDGTVWAWGNNSYGQLGDGTTTSRLTPVQVTGLTGVTGVSTAYNHCLAVKADGTVWAWGQNSSGQLGDGTTTDHLSPVQVASVSAVASVDAGGVHSLAMKADGTMWAWGWNGNGQLGDGTTTDRHTPVQVTNITNVLTFSAGSSHSLAVKTDGSVWAWGQNGYGQLGDGTTTNCSLPVQVNGLTDASAVSAGVFHSLVVKTDGTVWAWGQNSSGLLGDGTTTERHTPTQVSGVTNVTAVSTTGEHTLAVKTDGTIWAWGSNYAGQLGDGTITNRYTPAPVDGDIDAVSVSAGWSHSLANDTDGAVWAWGRNAAGQIGDGTTDNRYSPVQVSGLSSVVSVSAGSQHSLALKTDGTVWAWGYNWQGQLGDGTQTQRTTPIHVGALSDVNAVSAGNSHSLALKADGTVWAWGQNDAGQLGDGTTATRSLPVQVSGLTDVKAISAGTWHSLAVKTDGTVWAWGANDFGQLGDGTRGWPGINNNRSVPVQVNGLTNAAAVSAGGYHSMALDSDGNVWTWGDNEYGELGDGTRTDPSDPTGRYGLGLVSTLTNMTSVSAGVYYSLAVDSDGSVWGWGGNGTGQLGDGSRIDRFSPVQAIFLTNVACVSAGGSHSLAISMPKLAVSVQPAGASAGLPFETQPAVQVMNARNALVTSFSGPVSLSIKPGTGRAGAILSGTTTVNAVNGLATFSDLSINLAGAGYVLTAVSDSLASAGTVPFTVAQTPSKLVLNRQPAGAYAGVAFMTQPVIRVLDAENNIVTSFSGLISMTIKSGTGAGGATLGGVRTLPCLAGVATFHDLSIDMPGSAYVLTASSAGLTSADSTAFDVKPLPVHLVFTTQPGGAIKATRFTSQPVLIARDGNNAFIPDFNGPVVLAIKPGTGSPRAVLSGTTTIVAVNGVATFTDLSIDSKGSGFVLQASVGGIVLGESTTFNVTPKAERLVFTTQPGAATDDWPFGIQPIVTVQDSEGDTAALFTGSISVDIKSGTGAEGAVLTGTRTIIAPQGVATFTDLGIPELGSGYVLTATASGLISGDSTPFDVTEAPKLVPAQVSADIVEISVHPAGQTITGTWITLSWDENDLNTVSASDVTPAEGWTLDWMEATSGLTLALSRTEGVTSNGPVVSIRLTAKPGVSGRTIPVTLTGESYLTDSTFNNTPVKSRTIAFIPGAQMAFTQQPVATTAGYAIAGQPTVAMLDGTGAVVADYAVPMTVALKPGTGTEGAVLDGTTTLIPISGVAVFTDLTIDHKGIGYVLTVASGPFAVESIPFDIAPRALKLAFTEQPGPTRAGLPLTPYPAVTVQDEEGSTAFTYSGVITLAVKPGTGYPGVTLGGVTTVNAVSGIATFNNVNIGTASPGYVLVASGQSLTGAESLPFEVTPFAFTTPDIISALRWSAGLAEMPVGFLTRFDVVTNGNITLADTARISRKVAGLEGNP